MVDLLGLAARIDVMKKKIWVKRIMILRGQNKKLKKKNSESRIRILSE